MTRPTKLGSTFKLLSGAIGYDPDADIGDAPPPTDFAASSNGGYAEYPSPPSPIIQSAYNNGLAGAAVLSAAPEPGNTLVAYGWRRDSGEPSAPSPWILIAAASDTISFQRSCALWYHVVEADETPYQYTTNGYDLGAAHGGSAQFAGIVEIEGTFDPGNFSEANNVAATTTLTAGGSVTPDAGTDVIIVGVAAIFTDVSGVTEDADTTALVDAFTSGFSPYKWAGYKVVSGASGSYTVGGTMSNAHYCGVTGVFAAETTEQWRPAPNAIDGADETYQAVGASTNALRVSLDTAVRIVRAELLIGTATAGSKTYNVYGANEADFSDAVLLDSATFTGTGSYTAQSVSFNWTTSTAYQYFLLTGTAEARYIYSFELYEASEATSADLDAHILDTSDAHDASAISLLDISDYYAATDVEAALQEVAGGTSTKAATTNFVRRITSNASNLLDRPFVNFASGSNIIFTLDAGPGGSASSNTLRIHGQAGGGVGSVSAGSNSTRVSEVSSAGASSSLWSPFDHIHDGIGTITSSSSNTMQRGTWNIRPGAGIALSLTDTDGDGEFDTTTIINTGGGGGGSSSAPDPVNELFGTPTNAAFEFNTTSLAGLTAMATAADSEDANTTVPGHLYIRRNANATYRWVGRYLTPPSEPFTAITKVHSMPVSNFNKAALFVGVATPGNMDVLIYHFNTQRTIVLERDSQTAFSSTIATGPTHIDGSMWFAIRANSSTSYDYLYSQDGYIWRALTSARNPSLTIASVGVAVNPDSASVLQSAAFDFLRVWSSALTFPGV